MPVAQCGNGKWRIGTGKCIYKTKRDAESAYRGYLGSKYAKGVCQTETQTDTTNEINFNSCFEIKPKSVLGEVR